MARATVSRRSHSPLKLLFDFLIVGTLIGFGLYAYHEWKTIERDTTAELRLLNRLVTQTTDEIFNHYQTVLHILGDRFLETNAINHPERAGPLVDNLARINPALAGFGLARPDGQLVRVSGIDSNTVLPNLLHEPRSSESFLDTLETGRMTIGRTYYLPPLDRWVLPIRLARAGEAGEPKFVMAAGVDIDSPATTWNDIDLPGNVEVRILRPDGYWQFVEPLADNEKAATYDNPVDTSRFERITSQTHLPGGADVATYTMEEWFCVSTRLKRWGLYVTVTIPLSEIAANYRKDMAIPTAFFLSFLVASVVFYLFSMRQQRSYESRLIRQAHHDPLTDLPNRALAMDRLDVAIDLARREERTVAVAFLDIDHFKRINDSLGHLTGDDLLTQCAARLTSVLRAGDTVARLGADEFLIVLSRISETSSAETIASKIHAIFQKPFVLGKREVTVSCSIGMALYPMDGDTPGALLKAADIALYDAKDAGRNTHSFYSSEMNRAAQRRMEVESALRRAVGNQELHLVYQPQVLLGTGQWTGCEALVRWHNPRLGDVSPAEFIHIAEETGQIGGIGRFVIEGACAALAEITAAGFHEFMMAINVSAVQLRQPDLPTRIHQCLQDHHLPAHLLEIEITEKTMVENAAQLDSLHALGVPIAVDDFGTGFSSLGYLQHFPVSTLKIDRAFVKHIETDPQEAVLARAIVLLGQAMNLDVVAEGIETQGQIIRLREMNCRRGQGFHFSRPLPLPELLGQLQQWSQQRRHAD